MIRKLSFVLLLAGCALLPVQVDWERTHTAEVIVQEWISGFEPSETAHRDVLTVYGDGNWQATKTLFQNNVRSIVATGTIPVERMERLLSKATDRVGGSRFVDLPQTLDTGIVDAPTYKVSLHLKGATYAVTDLAGQNQTFHSFWSAIASETVPLPL